MRRRRKDEEKEERIGHRRRSEEGGTRKRGELERGGSSVQPSSFDDPLNGTIAWGVRNDEKGNLGLSPTC